MLDTLAQTPCTASLSASGFEALELIGGLQAWMLQMPQVPLATQHLFHGGMYARTIRLAAETVVAGALIRVPTLLVVQGTADVWDGCRWRRIEGYTVLPGRAGRKQVFVARSDVAMTMLFPTQALTVEDAEREFTDECEQLMSRTSTTDAVWVTGE